MKLFKQIKSAATEFTKPIDRPSTPWEEEMFKDAGRPIPPVASLVVDTTAEARMLDIQARLRGLGVPEAYLSRSQKSAADLLAINLAHLAEVLGKEVGETLLQGTKLPKDQDPAAGKRYNRRLPCPELLDAIPIKGGSSVEERQVSIKEMLADPALLVAVAGWIGVPSMALEAHLRVEQLPGATAPKRKTLFKGPSPEQQAEERGRMITWTREFRTPVQRALFQKTLLEAGASEDDAREYYQAYQAIIGLRDPKLHEYATWPLAATHLLHGERDLATVKVRLALAVEAPDLKAVMALLPPPGRSLLSHSGFVSAVVERALYAPDGSALRAELLGALQDAVARGALTKESVHAGVARPNTAWLLRYQPQGILTLAPEAIVALDQLNRAGTMAEEDAAIAKAVAALSPWAHPGSIATLLLADGAAEAALPKMVELLERLVHARNEAEFPLNNVESLLPALIEKSLSDGDVRLPLDGPGLFGLSEATSRGLISEESLRRARDLADPDARAYALERAANANLRAILKGQGRPMTSSVTVSPTGENPLLTRASNGGLGGKAFAPQGQERLIQALARSQPTKPIVAPEGNGLLKQLIDKESV